MFGLRLGAKSCGRKVSSNARTTWSAAGACHVGHRGTEDTGEGRLLSPTSQALLCLCSPGRRKQDGFIHWICIFNFAICITNPCKVNPGSNGLLLQERSEHIGTGEKGGNPLKILNKGWKREEVCRGFEQGFVSLSLFKKKKKTPTYLFGCAGS